MSPIPKFGYWRCEHWTQWVKSLPSCISQRPADDPHHIKGYSRVTGSGGGIKGDDLFVIPLTRDEHTEFDHIGWASWEQRYGSQLEHWARLISLGDSRGNHRGGEVTTLLGKVNELLA